MAKKQWRPGSAGEKEQKEQRIVSVIMILLSIALLCVQFVIPGQYRDAVIYTADWLNWIGGILVAGSCVPVILAFWAGEEGAASYSRAWIICLALGFLLAAVEAI